MPQALVHCFSALSLPFLPTMFDPNKCLFGLAQSASYWLSWPMIGWLLSAILWRYSVVMNGSGVTGWLLPHGGISCAHCHAHLIPELHFCGMNVINHFVCEILSFLKLACSDTSLNELLILITGIFTLLLPFDLFSMSELPLLSYDSLSPR